MKKKIKMCILVTAIIIGCFSGCASTERLGKDIHSDVSGGLDRTVNVYSYTGEKIATYTGKIDIDSSYESKVKFDLDGKRYIYYNCSVEVIEN